MNRATAAATTMFNPIHLTLQAGPSGTALVVSSTPSPFPNRTITMTRNEFKTFRLFMLHVLGLNNRTPNLGIGKISPIRDTTLEILYFLYADIARLIAPTLKSEHEQLECVAQALRVAVPVPDRRDYSTSGLYFINYSFDIKLGSLLNAALNADLETLKNILEKTHPEKRNILLSAESTATITHLDYLDIKRTGTALQMALYSGDEKMVEVIKQYMNDDVEFQRQRIKVFGPDYNAFLEEQKIQAAELCRDLQTAFTNAPAVDITNALNRIPGTTSALQIALNNFQQTLERYVRANPVHNPFILQTLFEIYDRLPFNIDMLRLFSQQAIGPTEKLSSAVWLQHLAQGIYQIMDQSEPLSRSFLLRDTRSDIRSLAGLGVNCCVDIFGPYWSAGARGLPRGEARTTAVSKLLSGKNIKLEKLMQPSLAVHAECQCVVQ